MWVSPHSLLSIPIENPDTANQVHRTIFVQFRTKIEEPNRSMKNLNQLLPYITCAWFNIQLVITLLYLPKR